MRLYTAKFNTLSRVRPCGMCEWTVESLYKDMATCLGAMGGGMVVSAFFCLLLVNRER